MPLRSWKIRISDIIEAIENVQEYSEGMTFDSFAADAFIKKTDQLTGIS